MYLYDWLVNKSPAFYYIKYLIGCFNKEDTEYMQFNVDVQPKVVP